MLTAKKYLTNSNLNVAFLSAIDEESKKEILSRIAAHYGISINQANKEVTDGKAEHLLDYMVEPHRAATYLLMQRLGFKMNNQMIQECNDDLSEELAFGIFHRTKKKWFLGFDSSNSPFFGEREKAIKYGDKLTARTQALLLVNLDRGVQKTPKRL